MHRRAQRHVARILFIGAGILCALLDTAMAQQPLVLRQGQSMYALGRMVDVLEDPQSQWRIEQISRPPLSNRFVRSQQQVPSYGFGQSVYWFRLRLHSRMSSPQKLLLEVAYPMLDHIEVFVEHDAGSFTKATAGDIFVGGNKSIDHSNFIFPFKIDPGQLLNVYLRVQSQGALLVPLTLWTLAGLRDHENRSRIINGLYYGFLIVMIFYNLFLFIATRDRSHLFFVIYACCVTAFVSSNDGLAQEYLWPAWPWWGNRVVPLSLFFACYFGIATTRVFLELEAQLPLWDRILSVFAVTSLVGAIAALVLPYNPVISAAVLWVAVSIILGWFVPFLSWRRGKQLARYYLISSSVLILGVIIVSLERLAIIPPSPLTDDILPLSFGLNVIFSSIALADRINFMRRDKERAQVELERAYAQMAEHDRLKSSFFANVSHELRTPLTLILTPIDRLLAGACGPVAEEIREWLWTIRGNAHRLLQVVNQLLDFSRIESGGTTVSFERRDVRALLEPIVAAFKQFARSKGIQLELRGSRQLPAAYVDPAKLERAVSNILSNACKFTESGGNVVVRLEQSDMSLKLSVKDTGIGIGETDQLRLFERFHQVDSRPALRHQGTGIGLALSKELIELSGGTIEVESELGIGSTFTITLPLGTNHVQDLSLIRATDEQGALDSQAEATATVLEAADEPTQPEAAEPHAVPHEGATTPLLVVVDNNPDMRALVREIFQDTFQVMETPDAPTALALIREQHPALAISEVMLPGIDGHELLRLVRSDPATASIPVMLLTAKAASEQRIEGLEGGADDFLDKPFESRVLLARAKNLVRLQRQEVELRQLNEELQREVVMQAAELARVKTLGRFLPPEVARTVIEEDSPAMARRRREQLTVFRLELRGFEKMSSTVEPEDLTGMLNSYLSEMIDIAFEHGATVDRFVRDTVVAFLGAPTSDGPEQDAIRCARMATTMWERAVDICRRWKEVMSSSPPVPTAVLCTGFATVGTFGSSNRLEYTAVGGPVDQAREILGGVMPGEVVCTQSTWELIEQTCDGKARGKAPVSKGTIRLYRLAGPPQHGTGDTHHVSAGEAIDTVTADRIHLEPGTGAVVSGRYRIVRLLGEGSTGTIFLVRDMKLDVDVILKLLPSGRADATREGSRLYRATRLARLIRHTNVARIFDIGEWEGREYVTMEHVPGRSLRARLRADGSFSFEEGLEVMRQLCAGLGAAHAAGVVHHDLNPTNIMLGPDGRIAIHDFGLAGWLSAPEQIRATGRSYLAPEQLEEGHTDHRADIYALGAVAFEMFYGTPPTPAALTKTRPDLPPRLVAVIHRCMDPSPQKRFGPMGEIISLLEMIRDHKTGH